MIPATSSSDCHASFVRSLACTIGSWSLIGTIGLTLVTTTWAADPCVHFDTAPTVACQDVTPPQFAAVNPGERLIEARFEVSSLVQSPRTNLIRSEFLFENPDTRLRIVDYAPRSLEQPSISGNIAVDTKLERSHSLGVNVSPHIGSLGKAAAFADTGRKKTVSERYEKLPPLETVLASGTLHRSRAAFFRLKRTERQSLAGDQQFKLVLQVPQGWQAGYIHLRCTAITQSWSILDTREKQCGRASFVIGLFDEARPGAKALTERLTGAEQQLRLAAAHSRRAIEQHRFPSPLHKLGATLEIYQPDLDAQWMERVLFDRQDRVRRTILKLPPQLQAVAREYASAKQALLRL